MNIILSNKRKEKIFFMSLSNVVQCRLKLNYKAWNIDTAPIANKILYMKWVGASYDKLADELFYSLPSKKQSAVVEEIKILIKNGYEANYGKMNNNRKELEKMKKSAFENEDFDEKIKIYVQLLYCKLR